MIQPLFDRIFIRLKKENTSSLILPEEGLNMYTANQGIVVAVGEKVNSVQAGDEVIFHPFDELPTFDPDLVVIREKSLLGKINK